MKNNYIKLFLDKNKIIPVKYSPAENNYYAIVKENHKKGYKQVIITSKIMTDIIKEYFYNRAFRISSIEFMEEDEYLREDIDKILEQLKSDRAYIGNLLEKIKFLSEDTAIDIKRMELHGKGNENKYVNISIQVNGIIGINERSFDEELADTVDIIERNLI